MLETPKKIFRSFQKKPIQVTLCLIALAVTFMAGKLWDAYSSQLAENLFSKKDALNKISAYDEFGKEKRLTLWKALNEYDESLQHWAWQVRVSFAGHSERDKDILSIKTPRLFDTYWGYSRDASSASSELLMATMRAEPWLSSPLYQKIYNWIGKRYEFYSKDTLVGPPPKPSGEELEMGRGNLRKELMEIKSMLEEFDKEKATQ